MWIRPRGPSDSAASRSNVGQAGRQSPHETHWRASSSKRSRRVVGEVDRRHARAAAATAATSSALGGRRRARGRERLAGAGVTSARRRPAS